MLVERGKPVEARGRSVGALFNRGLLDPESNLCYGEGGAGTWSDGKLTTRIGRNSAQVRRVLRWLVQHGAPERILVDGKPHLGTDRLVRILRSLRAYLLQRGALFVFDTRVENLLLEDSAHPVSTHPSTNAATPGAVAPNEEYSASCLDQNKYSWTGGSVNAPHIASGAVARQRVRGVRLANGTELLAPYVVLAVGHSARALYRMLHSAPARVEMRTKAIAAGFRVEHPQELINSIQYGGEQPMSRPHV